MNCEIERQETQMCTRSQMIDRCFDPYVMNGGSVVAVAGDDYVIFGSDTRLSEGYNILSRTSHKIYQTGDKFVTGMCGFYGDVLTLGKRLDNIRKVYKYKNFQEISMSAHASMLSKQLYYRRFFPYYVYNIVGGLDQEGVGYVYGYDPVGSYQREKYAAIGSASKLIMPMLDSLLKPKDDTFTPIKRKVSLDEAYKLVHDVFISAAERDIYTGDEIEFFIITKEGIKNNRVKLRRD